MTGHITELVGESGTGKTQMCLQASLSMQSLPDGMGGCALYIHTDSRFPLRRLTQLSKSHSLKSCRNSFKMHGDFGGSVSSWLQLCENVFVKEIQTAEELLGCVSGGELRTELERPRRLPIRAIIIDSIASLIRSEFHYTKDDMALRSSLLFEISSLLKQLAETFHVAVIVTNQVTEVMTDVHGNSLRREDEQILQSCPAMLSYGRPLLPALGLSWSHCVNTRIFLSRKDSSNVVVAGHQVLGKTKRRMSVIFSPCLPQSAMDFKITEEGVKGVHDLDFQQTNEKQQFEVMAIVPYEKQ